MSENEQGDGVRSYRIAGKKGYVIVAAVITMLLGGPLVDVVITATYPGDEKLIGRIDELEKTVHLLEHAQILECRDTRIVYSPLKHVDLTLDDIE